MITEGQIRERLCAYLVREITLNDFEDWLVQRSWNMHQDSDESAQKLVAAIELRLSEYSDDHLPDAALDRELQGLLARPQLIEIAHVGPIEPRVVGGTSNTSEPQWVRVSLAEAA